MYKEEVAKGGRKHMVMIMYYRDKDAAYRIPLPEDVRRFGDNYA